MDTVVLSLQDLIFYFRPPEEELEHEDKQFKLRSLKNRQNLFQEEVGLFCQSRRYKFLYLKTACLKYVIVHQGMITLVLECVDRLNVYNTAAHFSEYAGEEAAESWKEIVNLLYELLGRTSCRLISCFDESFRLLWSLY